MDGPSAPRPRSPHQRHASASAISAWLGLFAATIGGLVLLGWVLEVDTLKTVYGPITMKTNAAIALLLAGTSLWAHSRAMRSLGTPCAAVAAAIGALTLSQHLFGWDLGIDQLLFSEPAGAPATASPNRMGPNASTSLSLAGVSLLLLFRGTPRAIASAQRLAAACIVLALLAIAGYMYGAAPLYAVARYTGIALHTAITVLLLHAGVLLARVDAGPMTMFVEPGPAGTVLRRLVAPIVVIPLVLAYLFVRGRELDLFDRAVGISLFAVLIVVVFGMILWRTAHRIAVSDDHRRRAEGALDQMLLRERRARDEAERANRLKDQFIAMLSHELRTPLNVMLGWTRVLETETSPERNARAAGVVARNGRLLARLVEDLLDISRVSAGQFEIARRPMHFNQVVQVSIDAMTPVAQAKGIQITRDLDPAIGGVEADPERIQQIASNLLSNAVKFTPEGGRVDLRTALEGDQVVLTVADSGIGFDEAFAKQLFQPFRQADSSARREHGGLGLGLSIARHIAELHGGTLAGRSAGPEMGATFTLVLPLARTGARPPAGEAARLLST